MDIRKSGLENSSGTQEKWYVFDDQDFVIGEFFLPKTWSDNFARFLTSRKTEETILDDIQVFKMPKSEVIARGHITWDDLE